MDSFGSNHPAVAGKGWVCSKKPLWEKGLSTLGSASVPSTTSEKCPQVEPEVGKNNSCLNGLTAEEISKHPLVNSQRPNRAPVDWGSKFK
ncbi:MULTISPECIES: hypothetical protein [Prochlorococcus]|uniref:Uncharacterized protein n=1 Tax=Prochlorococcus marinus (strain SARG / CCMP1375 / SS120) TaxID=167539 RepID=Q7VAC0_PROMA|nr:MULTISPECIES: hypothetical protein [Prochlorococcus]AAQ00588.1 Predicted protein family PM-18 [Prochlorococcus marinus subsp. marinus str. CCMP1375]KGG10924.1 putative protein family PM-18 [Prochlorococcus marinus str. LG]KGG20508.1 putative protein family PM-18 [Prochlorococcus marinus str. SS2]KGG24173.1 putative protein family PM-18 [Prochlorococcus marinus str. SS35]KGG31569.1 putative protein family PM-18 [Prochlorococcus marinus str. SS51]